jgi:putative component of toxin-antitoxin plasmid stabilization module
LRENPFRGKSLGYSFFKEKKVKGYRVYYLIFKEEIVVLLVSISNKKNQQEIINKVKKMIPFYREKIKEGLFKF